MRKRRKARKGSEVRVEWSKVREEECEREVEGERGKNVREWCKVIEGRTGREWRQRKPGCKGAMCSFLLLLHQVHQAKPDGQFLLMNTQFVCTVHYSTCMTQP